MTHLNYAAVVARVEAAAKGREDYVNAVPEVPGMPEYGFETCTYLTDDGRPSCIVGSAFYTDIVAAGVVPEIDANRARVGRLLDDYLLISKTPVTVTRKARRFLEKLQGKQDSGVAWGPAIEHAKHYIENSRVEHDDNV